FEDGELRPLPYRTVPIARAAEAFQHMARARHIGKIVLRDFDDVQMTASLRENEGPVVRSDASYLIAGGLGGLGLATAKWLVEQGARNLVLLGRRGASSPEAAEGARVLQAAGARVVLAAVDITCRHQVAELLAEVRRSMPPLRGVVHSTMVLGDGLLAGLD